MKVSKAKWMMGFLVVQVIFLFACSPKNSMAHRLKEADRVIYATTVMGDDFSITVTGEQVNRIVQAIANARRISPFTPASPQGRLEFYKGSAHLGSITNTTEIFAIGDTLYQDTSGTLENLHKKCREEYLLKFR